MAEHHSKSTMEATYWCKPCKGPQLHTVADGRRGSCKACMKRLAETQPLPASPKPTARQDSLFALNGFDDVQYAAARKPGARSKNATQGE